MDWFNLASAVAQAVLPILGFAGLQELKKRNVNTVYYEAVGRAGGVALNTVLASGKPVTKATLTAAAVDGVRYLADNAAQTLLAKGVTSTEQATAVVAAEALRQALAANRTTAN